MGTWGPGIFSDDIAADVRDRFRVLAAEQPTNAAATRQLLAEYEQELDDADDGPVVWLALAAVQHKLGRLTVDVKRKALRIIDSGAGVTGWQDLPSSLVNQRKKHLTQLRARLVEKPPAPRKVRQRPKSTTSFKPGDVFTYELSRNLRVRMFVLHRKSDLGGAYADICLLGLDDGTPFRKSRIAATEILGPKYRMLSHEPRDRIVVLARGIARPKIPPFFVVVAPNGDRITGQACTWKEFPDVVRKVIRKLGWKKPDSAAKRTN